MSTDPKLIEAVARAPKIRPRVRKYPVRPILIMGPFGVVPLTNGQIALIDAEDAALVGERNWSFRIKTNKSIAHSCVRLECGRYVPIPMHRLIMSAPDGTIIDHINGDSLDNRKSNLRFATYSGNVFNAKRRSDNRSGFKGVSFHKRTQQWWARIKAGPKRLTMGPFASPEAAHEAYCKAAYELHGEFARVA